MRHCTLPLQSPQELIDQILVRSEPTGGLQHHLAGSGDNDKHKLAFKPLTDLFICA
jgi:hypothetical protein